MPALFGGWMALLGLAFALMPDAQLALRLVAAGSAVVAVAVGLRRNQTSDRLPWRLLVVAIVLSGVGGTMFADVAELRQAGALLLLAAYPLLALVLLIFIRRRTGARRDRAGRLDALTLTSGVALLVWGFLLGPHLQHGVPAVMIAFPLGDLLLLGMLTRLLTTSGRVTSGVLLGGGLFAMLVADIGYELAVFDGDTRYVASLGRFAFYAAAGMAALHPSMTLLSRPGPAPRDELSRARLAMLGIASMVAPAVLLVRLFTDTSEVSDLAVVSVLAAATFLLVLVRMAGIMSSHRLALARERALREASAALVSAADVEAVDAAVRVAVAHLLPADTPHGVVLALPITPDDPLSPEAYAQAAHDRETGTAARQVRTRDVDWAVSVRLSQFPQTLRCPLVLTDRPTGDPLVGVLHVGAPTDALPGLRHAVEVLAGQVALVMERIGLSQEVIRRNSETYFRTLVQNTADVIFIVDDQNRIRWASPSAATTFGGDPTGVLLHEVILPADRDRLTGMLASVRAGGEVPDGLDLRALGLHRGEILLELHCRDLRDEPTVAGLVLTLRDVTEPRRLQQELLHQAFHDAMTGLANRVLFNDRLQHALARGARNGSVVGVLFIDLDDFKIVNDTLGHAAGDQLLIGVAHRIAGALRADDTAARLGGDEFAALVENVQDPGAVEETAQRILTAMAEPIVLDDGTELTAVASIGITTTPEADSADELLRQADLALYVAKGAGKNQWRRFQSHLHDSMVERLELRTALKHAMNEGQFLLAYQPIVDLSTDEAVGFEALVRWHHPAKGTIAPNQFIEVAEESGLIVPMGRWVVEQALHTVAQWRRILPRVRQPFVSVNVAVRQFREPDFVGDVLRSLDRAGVPPRALVIELTESVLADENEAIWSHLAVLREHGVRIAIDDFGSGAVSLANLRRRPVDIVKIDKALIDDMLDDAHRLAMVTGIVKLAQTLELTVVAEGIESERHRDVLSRLGCQLGQGYLFSTPVDGTEALGTMNERQQVAA